MEDKDMKKVSSISKEDAAALKIQSTWKAYVLGRASAGILTKIENKLLTDVDAAATKIQAHVRGHLVRKKIHHEKQHQETTRNIANKHRFDRLGVTVISRGLVNDDDYDSVTTTQHLIMSHICHCSEMKARLQIIKINCWRKYQVDLRKNLKRKRQKPAGGGRSFVAAEDKALTEIPVRSGSGVSDTEPQPVNTSHGEIVPQKSKDDYEKENVINATKQKLDNYRPQTRRGRGGNDDEFDRRESGGSQVTGDATSEKALTAESDNSNKGLHKNKKDISTSQSLKDKCKDTANDQNFKAVNRKDHESGGSIDNEVGEVKATAKESYICTNESDRLVNTSEMHDTVTTPQYLKEQPTVSKVRALHQTVHKNDSAGEKGNDGQTHFSSTAVTKNETQISPEDLEAKENEKPDDENSSKSQQSRDGLERMHLHHSSEMHDVVLLPIGAGESDSQKSEVKGDFKGSNPQNQKALESSNGADGLRHSSEYHDVIVLPLKPENEDNTDNASESEVTLESGQKHTEGPSVQDKDLDVRTETGTSSPIGLRHSSELHDVVMLPEMLYKKSDTMKSEDGGKH
nr:unnamed protein product [Callosobruchus analis]